MQKHDQNPSAPTLGGPVGQDAPTLSDLRRMLEWLFSGNGDQARALRDAFNGKGNVDTVLADMSRIEGATRPFKPNANQLAALKSLLTEGRYSALSPAPTQSEQVRRFWREMLSTSPGKLHDLHHRVVDLSADPNNSAKLEKVLASMREYAPNDHWDKTHVEALVELNVRDIRFKSLVWFPYNGDIW